MHHQRRQIMVKRTLVAIEDEEDIQELIHYNFAKEGYQVTFAASGEQGLQLVRSLQPGLILLDLMLPGMDGLEVCRTLRADPQTQHIPIVMLTAKGDEVDIVTGLELGADDYMTKPFTPRVLIARVRAVLRRKSREPVDETAVLKIHGVLIHPDRHEVYVNDQKVELTLTEFRILHLLARRPGWVFTRQQIIDGTQGKDVAVTDRSVDVHIVSLRRKLGSCGTFIDTIRGVGYKMKDE